MNLMILSPGRRCEIVRYFKKELNKNGKRLITLDMSEYAPALHFSDKFYVIEKDFDNLESYINKIIEICKEENVTFLLTLIDPELELLSRYRNNFEENDIRLILSDEQIIKSTFDKLLFYSEYKDKLRLIKTYRDYREILEKIEAGELNFPIIAKPLKGSASIGIKEITSRRELEAYRDAGESYIFQEYIFGKEIGVDVYFDIVSDKIVSIFMKEKIAMRAGETDKSISFFQKEILDEILKLETCKGFKGPLDVDIFVSEDDKIYLNEINPRFGGGYPHAHYCGVDFIRMIVNNMNGMENKINFGNYQLDVKMMKYNGILFERDGNIYEG